MGRQIIRQPNGFYAQWSSVVDDFVMLDATPEDIIADWNERDARSNERKVQSIVAELEAGKNPYFQFTKTFDECVKEIRERHGEKAESLALARESGLIT